MKIVLNKCYGGFGLSPLAISEYLKLKGKKCFFYKENGNTYTKVSIEEASNYDTSLTNDYGDSFTDKNAWKTFKKDYFYDGDIERSDTDLVKVVETLGEEESSGSLSELRIVEIPDGIDYEIDEYDGIETVHETHRSW